MEIKRVTIIGGGGKMGRWMARFLRGAGFAVTIYDTDKEKLAEAGRYLGVTVNESLAGAVSGAGYIVLSVPIEGFEGVVSSLKPHLEKGQAVIDITSTKTLPVEVMHRYITSNPVLGAHPLFGPGASAVLNKNVVMTPTSDEESVLARKISAFLEEKGARVSIMSPEEHDRMMSLILGLSHFIALVTADTLLGSGTLHPMEAAGSSTYKVLLTLVESVLSEDPELYASIQMSLPNVGEYEAAFLKKTREWTELVARKDRGEFAKRMQSLKEQLETVSPGFRDSYENMYRIVEGL